ncbi:hypothetical protein ARAF_0419 [Arsenophonus endosymbiont of Aleurodicus floccissimus]|uniref:phage tail fiber protein n=1 Tax=Arsenophonus endosymbiont of Aleurodicus floccissimus TaxID=2152761 RepID=UPI000EC7048F|nr:hypothetical protein [Arsenophonus endosymbiont of Aleurodicus floccissimus]SPP31300.1 hypothetical protein ARAF_0419 [Arsenophonus endosymbiont of Aleurodicus floccissimus]
MGETSVVELTLPSGKTIKLESIKALQELVKGKADIKSVEGINKKLDTKYDKAGGEITGDVQLSTGKIRAKNANNVTNHAFQDKNGTLMHVGDFGIKIVNPAALGDINVTLKGGFYNAKGDAAGVPSGAGGTNFIQSNGGDYCFQIGKENLTDDVKFRVKRANQYSAWQTFYSTRNVKVDSNGFLKRASPIIEIHPDGSFETNDQSAGVNVRRTRVGTYFISGVMGYNSDGGWGINAGISVPKNSNGLELVYIKDKILSNGRIEIQTFHRQHAHLLEDFQNWRIKNFNDNNPVITPMVSGVIFHPRHGYIFV